MAKFIVVAEKSEESLIAKANLPGTRWKDAEVLYTGVGAINVIRSLSGLDRSAELLNIGYAGSANFEIGTWVEVTEVRLNHPNVRYEEPVLTLQSLGANEPEEIKKNKAICYSNCDFVLQSDYKDCVFDMELAFIASLGFKSLCSLKYVSDNLSLHAYREHASGVEETV